MPQAINSAQNAPIEGPTTRHINKHLLLTPFKHFQLALIVNY